MKVAPVDIAPKFDTTNHIMAVVNIHATFIQGESLPIIGIAASIGRVCFSSLELMGGAIGYTLSGGCCCIPCPVNQPCTAVLDEWQTAGRVHMALGAFGLIDSLANIATGSLYQCLSSGCNQGLWGSKGRERVKAIATAAYGSTL